MVFHAVRDTIFELKIGALDEYPEFCTIVFDPAGISSFKVCNRNIKTTCGICSKFTIKTPEPERRH